MTQRFADNSQATLNATHTNIKFDSQMMYLDAVVNKETGQLVGPYGNYSAGYDYVGGTGWNIGERKVDSVDLFTDGKYELLGNQHTVMLGGSYNRQTNRYLNTWANIYPDELGSFYDYDGNFPETQWDQQTVAQDDKTYMKSLHAATRISLADPLNLIIGARYINWRIDAMTYSMEKTILRPTRVWYMALMKTGRPTPVILLSSSHKTTATVRVNTLRPSPATTMKSDEIRLDG